MPSQKLQLEQLLRLIAEDRHRYYKMFMARLLESKVYFILSPFVRADLSNLIDHQNKLRINIFRTADKINLVPFFSSLAYLEAYDPRATALPSTVQQFLHYTKGRGLILNPGHPYQLCFNHEDAKRLMYFDYRTYLQQMAEEEKSRQQVDGREAPNVIDFSRARNQKDRSR